MTGYTAEPNRRKQAVALTVVSVAVLLSSSTWFSGTAVASWLRVLWSLSDQAGAWLTSAAQIGFIFGTLLYAYLNLADRMNPRNVFLFSAILGAVFNAAFAWLSDGIAVALPLRFLTGVTLAGIYPVGMKIIATWFRSGLGWGLGVMVGALTLGTASPYFFRAVGAEFDWRVMVTVASISTLAGGILIRVLIGDGPYLRSRATIDGSMALKVFRSRQFRYVAFGYFGHMWELYAFWSLVAFYLIERFRDAPAGWSEMVPLVAFSTVGVGAVGCVVGGWLSRRVGERNVALVSLAVSGGMCCLSGLAFDLPATLLIPFLLIWGIFVVADSPQFSALAARYSPPEYTGTALTVQNGVGFAITIVSIQLLPWLAQFIGWRWVFTVLSIGPFLGAYALLRLGDQARVRSDG